MYARYVWNGVNVSTPRAPGAATASWAGAEKRPDMCMDSYCNDMHVQGHVHLWLHLYV